ncbi:hypothetical protein ABZ923_41080 [Streptomyces sp. NPDC046881]|uniref:hypothetical protein n=1 Tax=Streptomyces sp. NPDC046881 TaxID=3155374 RepID=UPI0033C767B2
MPNTAPSSPTVAIARVLRGLGLTQGRGCDFRVTGDYRNGERVGTFVLVLGRHAEEVVAANADEIERLSDETGFPFRVSVRYFNGKPRPVTSIANYGSRVRDTPPASADTDEPAPAAIEEPAEAAPTVEEPPAAPESDTEDDAATELPPPGTTAAGFLEGARTRAWGRQRANALGWSERQAYLVASAGTAALSYDANGVLRDRPRPGWSGTAVDEARLTPLIKAGFITVTEPYGPGYKRVSMTADGREALFLWRVYRPTPAVKDRKQEREPLQPLIGGETASRLAEAWAEDERRSRAEREAFYAAMDELHAWEDREEKRAQAWAKVQGFTHRLGRKPPADWVPTAEEIAEHLLDPAVVDDLRAEATRPTPKPELPKSGPVRLVRPAPLPALPAATEQLSLFAEAA